MSSSSFRSDLSLFSGFLSGLGRGAVGIGPDGVKEVAWQLREIGFPDEADAVKRRI